MYLKIFSLACHQNSPATFRTPSLVTFQLGLDLDRPSWFPPFPNFFGEGLPSSPRPPAFFLRVSRHDPLDIFSLQFFFLPPIVCCTSNPAPIVCLSLRFCYFQGRRVFPGSRHIIVYRRCFFVPRNPASQCDLCRKPISIPLSPVQLFSSPRFPFVTSLHEHCLHIGRQTIMRVFFTTGTPFLPS